MATYGRQDTKRTIGRVRAQHLSHHVSRIIRFGVVGLSGLVVNYAVLVVLVDIVEAHLLLATAIATEVAILNNFTLNNIWTFRDAHSRASLSGRLLRYNVFALGGLAISVVVMGVLAHQMGMHYLLANLFAIGSATLWNYAMNARWTWSVSRVDDQHAPAVDRSAIVDPRAGGRYRAGRNPHPDA